LSSWYSWKIAHLALNINHSLLFSNSNVFRWPATAVWEGFYSQLIYDPLSPETTACTLFFSEYLYVFFSIYFTSDPAPFLYPHSPKGGGYTVLPLSVSPSVQDIFRHIFLSNYWWQRYDIWSQASYRYPISWEAFLDPSDSYFLFADFVDFYTHWTYILYMPIFSHIFLSNYWWQKSDIWRQASYRYPISWEEFLDPSDSYFLFAEERGYHNAHSSYCLKINEGNCYSHMKSTSMTTSFH
jgi:hypothetical protein